MQIQQLPIMGLLKQENTLRSYLSKIGQMIDSDVISYYGLISEDFINHLLRIAKETQIKSGKNRLTLILMSKGGEIEPAKKFYEDIYNIYPELYIIANDRLLSAATLFSFFADKLYLFDDNPISGVSYEVCFGMIDPQLPANHPDGRENVYTSAFYFIGAAGFDFKLNDDTDELEKSFCYSHPQNWPTNHLFVHQSFQEIFFVRKLAFDALINHNLKSEENRGKKAISIINFLMDIDKHKHDHVIYPKYLEERGLKITRFPDDANAIIGNIKSYNETVLKYLDMDGNSYVIANNWGNRLNCLIQSVNELII